MKTLEEPYAMGSTITSELVEDRNGWIEPEPYGFSATWIDHGYEAPFARAASVQRPAPRIYMLSKASLVSHDAPPPEEPPIAIAPDRLNAIFSALADSWITRTQFSSSLDDIFGDAMLEALLGLGRPALPLAFERFKAEPERWHHVLVELSGVQPLGATTTRDEAAGVWAAALGFDA